MCVCVPYASVHHSWWARHQTHAAQSTPSEQLPCRMSATRTTVVLETNETEVKRETPTSHSHPRTFFIQTVKRNL